MKRRFLLILSCLLQAYSLNAKDIQVRVLIYSVARPQAITITPDSDNVFVNDRIVKDPLTLEARGSLIYLKHSPPKKELKIELHGKGAWLSGKDAAKRLYTGLLEVTAENGKLKIINSLPSNDYLASVVSAEARDLSQTEAFKAQAIAARTYMFKHVNNHAKDGYNLCDSTHCQFFSGFGNISAISKEAVDFTRNEIVTYHGAPASTFYHSICGGKTEAMVFVWPFEHKPYLISVKDGPDEKPYCSIAPGFRWKTRISMRALTAIARTQRWINPDEEVIKLIISDYGISKRASTLEISTRTRKVKVSATSFYHGAGRKVGWNAIRSSYFKIYSGTGYIVLEGKGNGHGVGMCQWGAEGMARLGFKYREILKHYYPGTEISYD